MDNRYLTSGKVARIVGVSKGTVLRAVQRGDLVPTLRMPGGSLRFLPSAVDAYARTLGVEIPLLDGGTGTRQQVPSRRRSRFNSRGGAGEPTYTWRTFSDAQATGPLRPDTGRLSSIDAGETRAQVLVQNVLALLADSLRAGAAGFAREVAGIWHVEQAYDRMGLGLAEGGRDDFSASYGSVSEPSGLEMLIVEDVVHDARFSALAEEYPGIASYVSVRLVNPAERLFGALFVAYPHTRSITSDETALLRLAGQIVLDLYEAFDRGAVSEIEPRVEVVAGETDQSFEDEEQ